MADAATEVAALCAQLVELQARRKFYIGLVNKQTNAIGALVRLCLNWSRDLEEKERAAIVRRAAAIVSAALAGKPQKPDNEALAGFLAADFEVFRRSLAPPQEMRAAIERDMRRLVRRLPVEDWRMQVRGLGEIGLASIVGEAGDLSGYATPAKLWKRLGLAPHQGKAASTWRYEGGLTAEDWTTLGYAPRRRAEIHACVGEPLFRAQSCTDDRRYRETYDLRRARTAQTHPDWRPARSHADGLRIMTKRLILDLWSEWRRTGFRLPHDEAVIAVSAADISAEHDTMEPAA